MIDSHYKQLQKIGFKTALPLSHLVDVYYNKQVDKYFRNQRSKKDVNETQVVKEGEIYWMIKLKDGTFYDTADQDVVQQLSLMCEIMSELDSIKRDVKEIKNR
jgi:hypothetical protein